MKPYFKFERDFVADLRCIPMTVRYKLDTCGVKLKLSHWHAFSQEIRQALVDKSCTTPEEIKAYREWLHRLVLEYTNAPAKDLPVEENPPWMDTTKIPDSVKDKAQQEKVKITLEQWANLSTIQRFVLIKLSRPSHENKNFLPAIKEFNLG
ncbi:MAG: nitrate reductase maturation protein NarM [Okeania sp. SIO2H7]|nr:nitrate reductase maturation protein NarM [Okeania sp. SIO2H7]